MLGPKERFTSRVEDYIRYRPFYPPTVLTLLQNRCGLTPGWVVADIGAGPGNLTRLFLGNGNKVLAVEPNQGMRLAGESLLKDMPNYISIDRCAEATGLESNSVDLIAAGQAFHWFDQAAAKTEFKRVLRPAGWVVLIWNMRQTNESSFSRRYDEILRMLPEYAKVKADQAPIEELRAFVAPGHLHQVTLDNHQRLGREAFLGRVLSSSYIPQAGQPGHEPIMEAFGSLFESEQKDGEVLIQYDTQIYFGQME